MRYLRFMPLFLLLVPVLFSCDKSLNVNAEWKDVTVVYCLLDQTDDTTFIKITKAFLGEGDALMFSKIPDSSNYPDKLEVRLNAYANATDTAIIKTYHCDTVTIHNKKAGDSIFYFPSQLMYFTTEKLNANYFYKLYIRNNISGKVITSQTALLSDFEILRPQYIASFTPGGSFQVKWTPSKNGKRYQMAIRFYYLEALKSKKDSLYMKSIEGEVFGNEQPIDINSTQPFDNYYSSEIFYSIVGTNIHADPLVDHRVAHHCDFIFTVGTTELNTYLEVTKPSLSLVQERPAYTNIINGIGLFSARFMKSMDSLGISQITKDELKVNPHTSNLGF